MSEADQTSKTPSKNELSLKSVAVDCATMTATHPITLIKTLIQLGHEPLPPYTGRSWTFAKKQGFPVTSLSVPAGLLELHLTVWQFSKPRGLAHHAW